MSIKLVKQPASAQLMTGPYLADSVLPRPQTPRAISRGIVKQLRMQGFANVLELVRVVVGENQRGDSVAVVVDANRNGNFRDDRLHWFRRDSSGRPQPPQYARLLVGSPRGLVPFWLELRPYQLATGPQLTYGPRLERRYFLQVGLGEVLTGRLPGGGPADSLRVVNDQVSPAYLNQHKRVYVQLPGAADPARRYYLGSVFALRGRDYVVTRLSPYGDSLYLKQLTAANRKYYGVAEGSLLPAHTLRDLAGRPVVLPTAHGRMLLDFWGTWCAPCRELTPALQELHQAYPETLRMVSIAQDEKALVATYLQAHPMPWEQVAIPVAEADNSIIGQLRVEAYPTFILLQDGLIVYRGTGKDGLLAAKQYLADHPLPGR